MYTAAGSFVFTFLSSVNNAIFLGYASFMPSVISRRSSKKFIVE